MLNNKNATIDRLQEQIDRLQQRIVHLETQLNFFMKAFGIRYVTLFEC